MNDLDMEETLKTDIDQPHLKWPGTYRRIPYIAYHWFFGDGSDQWNYYILPCLERIENKDKAEELWIEPRECSITGNRLVHDYHSTKWYEDVWFHRGCTYYERVRGLEGGPRRIVKIGCDYGHHGGAYTDIRMVLHDIKKTIDSFHDWCGLYLSRCIGCGDYFKPGTGEKNEQGDELRCGGDSDWCHYDAEEAEDAS